MSALSALDAAYALATLALYLGLLACGGLVLFDQLVVRGPRPLAGNRRVLPRRAAWVATVGAVSLVPLSAMRVMGVGFGGLLSPDAWLPGLGWRPVAVALGVTLPLWCALAACRLSRTDRWRPAIVALALIAVATPSLVGHTQVAQPRWLGLAADVVHLGAGAFWFGGLLGLVGVLRTPADDEHDPQLAATVLLRFSAGAVVTVGLLAASGVALAATIVGDPLALAASSYGRLLALKLLVVPVVLGLAAWNRFRLVPRVRAVPEADAARAALVRTATREAALLVLVLLITAFLTDQSPPRAEPPPTASAPATRSEWRAAEGGLVLAGELSPTRPGVNQVVLRFSGPDAATLSEVRVGASHPALGLRSAQVAASLDPGSGSYVALLTLPAPGRWLVEAEVVTHDGTPRVFTGEVTLG